MFINLKDKNNQTIYWGTAVLTMMVFVTLLFCFSSGISGNDFWWHVKAGEWICKNHKIPSHDIFSWYGIERNLSWTAHEWLSDVVYYNIYHFSGELGIYLFSMGSASCMIFLIWKNVKKYAVRNIMFSGLFFVILAVNASVFFYGRPHVFSFFLLFFELKCLYSFYENNESKGIYGIPLIACLWSNFHGGSSNLSYLLCMLFLCAGFFDIQIGCVCTKKTERKSRNKLLLVTAGTVLGTLVNPVGIKILFYPYTNMGDTFMLSVISEWAAPDAKNIGDLVLFFLPILIMSIGLLTENKQIRLIDLMVMLVFLFLFLRSHRFIFLWFIAAGFYAFRYLPVCRVKKISSVLEKQVLIIFMAVMLIPIVISIQKISKCHKNNMLITKVMSEEMINVIIKDEPDRIFNDYNLGEALIFNDIKVFVDGRADVYKAENILKDSISLLFLEQSNEEMDTQYVEVEKLLDKYGFDTVLILKNRPFYSYIISHFEKFECVYEDDTAGYFRIIKSE